MAAVFAEGQISIHELYIPKYCGVPEVVVRLSKVVGSRCWRSVGTERLETERGYSKSSGSGIRDAPDVMLEVATASWPLNRIRVPTSWAARFAAMDNSEVA